MMRPCVLALGLAVVAGATARGHEQAPPPPASHGIGDHVTAAPRLAGGWARVWAARPPPAPSPAPPPRGHPSASTSTSRRRTS